MFSLVRECSSQASEECHVYSMLAQRREEVTRYEQRVKGLESIFISNPGPLKRPWHV